MCFGNLYVKPYFQFAWSSKNKQLKTSTRNYMNNSQSRNITHYLKVLIEKLHNHIAVHKNNKWVLTHDCNFIIESIFASWN